MKDPMKKKSITDYFITSSQQASDTHHDTAASATCHLKEAGPKGYEPSTQTPVSLHSSASLSEERYKFLVDLHDKSGNPMGSAGYDPGTLFIPPFYYSKFTPFEKQFWDIKCEYFDTVVFFKKGKFYELYENDADIASREFGLRISDRVNMKMAGVPESSFEFWSGKFLERGYKIGKVDQVENMIGKNIREKENTENVLRGSRKEDKIIRRELKEVITQGTIYNYEHLKSPLSIFTAVIRMNGQMGSVLLYEASLNLIYVETYTNENEGRLETIFAQNKVVEVITDCSLKLDPCTRIVKPIKGGSLIRFRDSFANEDEYQCFLYLVNYMKYLKRDNFVEHVKISQLSDNNNNFMVLDSITLRNLEILENSSNGSQENTFFDSLNFCQTSQGKRELKKWVTSPLKKIEEIGHRQTVISIFEEINVGKIKDNLCQLEDLERLVSRLFSDNPSIKDLKKLIAFLENSITLFENLDLVLLQTYGNENGDEKVKRLCLNASIANGNDALANSLESSFEITEDSSMDQKNILRRDKPGCLYDIINECPNIQKILDDFKDNYEIKDDEIIPLNEDDVIHENIRKLKAIEVRFIDYIKEQKQLLKDSTLSYKHVGKEIYQIETKLTTDIPKSYFLVSSTKSTKRYYTKDLKMLVNEYVECEEKLFQSKGTILRRVIEELKEHHTVFLVVSDIVGRVDCFYSLSIFQKLTAQSVYPEFTASDLKFTGLRNPVYKNYIENDLNMDSQVLILTGPNMGGKSTFLRSVCLNILLAQMGLKVNCTMMKTRLFDRIFTRIGANDNILKGESTFMVELSETCRIIKNCTPESFIVIDELGRGTSTRDGEAIARAVIEYLKKKDVACMFSTHYHKMVERVKGVKKGYMKVVIGDGDIVFLYKIGEGICYDSHGIEVAKLAMVPNEIVVRARAIRALIENK